jgi:hypothetical protein
LYSKPPPAAASIGIRIAEMDDIDRCNEEFWDTRCDQPRGHRTAHSGRKGTARITWGNPGAGRGTADSGSDPVADG